MTQVASTEAIAAPLGEKLYHSGQWSQLYVEGDEIKCDLALPKELEVLTRAKRLQRPVALFTGSHQMQAYWYSVADESRTLDLFPFMYLIEDQRWIPRHSAFLKPASASGSEVGQWASVCIGCHTTHGRQDVERPADMNSWDPVAAETRVSEFGISCEACHGPGERHIAQTARIQNSSSALVSGDEGLEIVNPARLPHNLSSQICGQCHSVFAKNDIDAVDKWIGEGWQYRPGDELHDSTIRTVLGCCESPAEAESLAHSFWPDGMVRLSGREYSGLIRSPCFKNGQLSCLNCHRLHQSETDERPAREWANKQLDVNMANNDACLQCHSEYDDSASLARHTHHAPGSTGSHCYNCHMPYTSYGLLRALRSHEISSPDVRVTIATGRPNACNQCHLNRTLAWTANLLADWYTHDEVELTDDEQEIAASVLWSLRGDAAQRALMAWSFGWQPARDVSGTNWMVPFLAELMADPYDAVRYIAQKSLRKDPAFGLNAYDFLQNADLRKKNLDAFLSEWKGTVGSGQPDLLIGDSGAVRRHEVERLLSERNHRELNLRE